MKGFEPHPKADERRQSVISFIELLLNSKKPEMLVKHRRDLLNTMLWKYTEADGKYNTRYFSHSALKCMDLSKEERKGKLHHEHVCPREKLIDDLLAADLENWQNVLKKAIGCTVTIGEHKDLPKSDEECDGWGRYAKAKILVIDRVTGKDVQISDSVY
jgi:hypothetical protein